MVYTLGETGPANYTGGTWSCTNGVNVSNGNQITVPKGTQTECTITNTRDLAKLAVVKKVDGGASVPADWKLSAKAAAPNTDKNIVDRAGNITTLAEVYAGTEYTLSEDGPGNYTASAWQCTGTGVSQNGNKVSVAKGGEATCEITNTRDLAELKLVKKVTGDNGDKAPGAWDLTAAAAAPNNGKNFTVKGDAGTFQGVFAGTEYTLSENGPFNYTPSDWVCKDEQGAPVSSTGGKVTVTTGAKVTCEITNDRDTAELKLVKKVTGDNGAKVPNDWTLSAGATAPLNDKNFSNLGGQGTFRTVYSGVMYTLSESGPGDYTASTWVCKDEQGAIVPSPGGQIGLGEYGKVTCEITNDRDTAELKLVKKVTGGAGLLTRGRCLLMPRTVERQELLEPRGSGTLQSVYSRDRVHPRRDRSWGLLPQRLDVHRCGGRPVSSTGGKVTLDKGDKVTCEITNDRDLAS